MRENGRNEQRKRKEKSRGVSERTAEGIEGLFIDVLAIVKVLKNCVIINQT